MRKNWIGSVPLFVAPLAALAVPAAGLAQGLPLQVGTGVSYETYRFGDPEAVGVESLSLMALPFGTRVVVGPDIAIELGGAYASGSLRRPDGTEASISSLTDTELRASIPFGGRGTTFTLTGAAILPTGYSGYTREEAEVAGAIAADLLPFRVSNWGSGGGFALAGALARPMGDFNLGASVGYRVTSEFEPVSDFAYRPGNEMRVRLAADRTIGGDRKASLHLTLFQYAEDQFEGQNVLDAGDRVQLVGSYVFPGPFGGSAVAYAGMLHRTEGTAVGGFSGSPFSGLEDPPAQTLLLLGTAGRVGSRIGFLTPSVDLRMFRREDGIGQGYVLGVGTGAEMPLSGAGIVAVPTARLRFGNLIAREEAESGFTGAEIGFTVRFGDSTR